MRGRTTLAATLSLGGGVAAGVGSFLAWAEISAGPFSEQARGIDGWEGKVTLVAGVVMALAGVRALRGGDERLVRLRPRAALAGLVAAGVGLFTAITARGQLLDAAGSPLPRAQVERALDSGLLELSIALGLYVVIAGGVQGVLAALVATGSRDMPATVAREGLRGWAKPASGTGERGSTATVLPAPAPEDPPPRRVEGPG